MQKTTKLFCGSHKGAWMSKETDHVTRQKNIVLWECPSNPIQCINLIQLQSQGNFYLGKKLFQNSSGRIWVRLMTILERELIGRGVYQILKYFKSNITKTG